MLFYQGLSGVRRKALAPFLGGKGAARPLTYPVSGNVPEGNAPGPYPTIMPSKSPVIPSVGRRCSSSSTTFYNLRLARSLAIPPQIGSSCFVLLD